jgi:hypothetical protein
MYKKTGINVKLGMISLLLFCLATMANAQDEHRLTLNAGAGLTPLVGRMGNSLDNGWGITFGGGYVFTSHFESNVQVSYNGFGITSGFLASTGAPGGNSHLWSVTVDPKVRLGRERTIDPYVVGGVGYYRRTIQLTNPTLVPVAVFDPFFGFITGLAQVNEVIGSLTQDGIGGSLGAGFDIKLSGNGVRFFTEARYHYADTGRVPTRMVPVTFGLRW